MHKVLITTVVLSGNVGGPVACHAFVAEFDTKEEALGACVAINRNGSYPLHAQYAVPLFDADV